MSRWTSRVAFCVAAVVFVAFVLVRWAKSCADPGDPFDNYSIHPDIPLTKFARGNMGIVQPTFARSYLVLAYRYLSGVPLTKDEQQAAKALWQTRGIDASHIYLQYFPGQGDDEESANPYEQAFRSVDDDANDWANTRAQIVGTGAPKITPRRSLDTYNQYLNCAGGSFTTAASTLKQRVKQFGKDHPGVKEWIEAQDDVFANCGGDPEHPTLPTPAASSLPDIFRFDREYQIAAAYFYSNHFDEAERAFAKIAVEPQSPWHEMAPYLIARDKIRRATLDQSDSDAQLEAAAAHIRQQLNDPENKTFHGALEALLDRAEFRLHPNEQSARLSERLRKPAPSGRFYNWLLDYTWLLDTPGDYGSPSKPNADRAQASERQKDDLTEWIVSFQNDVAPDHALRVWHAHPDSKPWLLAALAKAEPKSPQTDELLAAAQKLPQTSPAFATAFYHRMRIESGRSNSKTVRESIDALLASPGDLPAADRETLLDLRLDSAVTLEDAVRFLPRSSCAVAHQEEIADCAKILTEHGAQLLDALPLETSAGLLGGKELPQEAKAGFSRNVFMRAVLLERHDVAQDLSRWIFGGPNYQIPVPAIELRKLTDQYQAATTPEEKQFAAIFLLQHLYAFGYEMGSTEPWCASPSAFNGEQTYYRSALPKAAALAAPAFLNEAQRKQALDERSVLDKVDSQANYYVKSVLDFANSHSNDPRIPEALSRAVKNTRMNCNNPRTGALSKEAFDLLHHRYGDTTWAKNTKYWYGSE